VSYVGNQSHDLLNTGGPGINANLVPVGALLNQTDAHGNLIDPGSLNDTQFRQYKLYGDLNIVNHNLYANYNALQATFLRAKGRYSINANYSYGKAMGILYSGTGASSTVDSFTVANNYAPQAGDRRHIFNAAYSVELGSPAKNKFAGGFINGWQLSGIAQMQSGANLTAQNGSYGQWGTNYNNNKTSQGFGISSKSILGTPNIQLNPYMICNPQSGLGSQQYINGSCYLVPFNVGQNGPEVPPAAYGPSFVNFDLGLFKNFNFTESKKLQLRLNGYNFVNHPLWSFGGSSNLNLNFADSGANKGLNQNSTFGYTTTKEGHRIVQVALKFYF